MLHVGLGPGVATGSRQLTQRIRPIKQRRDEVDEGNEEKMTTSKRASIRTLQQSDLASKGSPKNAYLAIAYGGRNRGEGGGWVQKPGLGMHVADAGKQEGPGGGLRARWHRPACKGIPVGERG